MEWSWRELKASSGIRTMRVASSQTATTHSFFKACRCEAIQASAKLFEVETSFLKKPFVAISLQLFTNVHAVLMSMSSWWCKKNKRFLPLHDTSVTIGMAGKFCRFCWTASSAKKRGGRDATNSRLFFRGPDLRRFNHRESSETA